MQPAAAHLIVMPNNFLYRLKLGVRKLGPVNKVLFWVAIVALLAASIYFLVQMRTGATKSAQVEAQKDRAAKHEEQMEILSTIPEISRSVENTAKLLAPRKTPLPKKQIASIEFQNARPFVDRAVLGNDLIKKSWQGYHFTVQINNNADDTTIRIKHLKITDLRKLDGGKFKPWVNAESVILKWDDTQPKEIPPQDNIFVPFARVFPAEFQRRTESNLSGDVDTPQFRFAVRKWPRRMTSHVPPGTHRFRITVFFEKVPPVKAELELDWHGKQGKSVESIVKELKIKKL